MNILPSLIDSSLTSQPYMLLLPLGLILIVGKLLSLVMAKIKVPEVVGYLLGGLLIGLFYFIPKDSQFILTDYSVEGINDLAKIGVVLILFEAGIETNLSEIKKQGKAAMTITCLGVVFPLVLGFLSAFLFRTLGHMDTAFYDSLEAAGTSPWYSDIYYGVILTATSVSITVATLKELGKLDGPVGTALVSAAIIDDVIGIVLLSIVISLSGGSEADAPWVIPTGSGAWSVVFLILIMAAFFAISIGMGIGVHKLFNWMGRKWPHHRRIPMFSLGFCFLWAFLAEVFHIADITGAYVAGLILANTSASEYIDHRMDTTANVLFTPVFFASVALKMFSSLGVGSDTGSVSSISGMFIIFGIVWVIAGLLGKILGAGSGALLTKSKGKEALIIGVGMMARAEVLIVTAQEGVDSGLVESAIIPFTLALILISSFLTPILLRYLYKNVGSKLPKVEGAELTNTEASESGK